MTIKEAKEGKQCCGCVWRLIGPGPLQCMAVPETEDKCPGRTAPKEIREQECAV